MRDLELHAAQLQVLMKQVEQERDFVMKENAQLRLAVKGLFKVHAPAGESKDPPVVIAVDIPAKKKQVMPPHSHYPPRVLRC